MNRIIEAFRDRVVLASSILGGAIVVAAIILAYGMVSLGENIRIAGANASGPSSLRVQVVGPVEVREPK